MNSHAVLLNASLNGNRTNVKYNLTEASRRRDRVTGKQGMQEEQTEGGSRRKGRQGSNCRGATAHVVSYQHLLLRHIRRYGIELEANEWRCIEWQSV